MASFLWLDAAQYPRFQSACICAFAPDKKEYAYCVAEFRREFHLPKRAREVKLRVFGDTTFHLYLNGQLIGIGPAAAGGDFNCVTPLPRQYANRYTVAAEGESLSFFAQVQLSPVALTDYSCGHGGFYLEAEAELEDGSSLMMGTDETWMARRNGAFVSPGRYDESVAPDAWGGARVTEAIWNLQDAPIPMLQMRPVIPESGSELRLPHGGEGIYTVLFDKIYAGYVQLEASGPCEADVECFELEGQAGTREAIALRGGGHYCGLNMHSVGGYRVRVKNTGEGELTLRPSLLFTCYPVGEEGAFACSDQALNKVYEVCKWTLQICRQTLHLDSPRHQEPLACTGDYYIETLMTAFTFGDMRLAALDVVRTADWIRQSGGVMFHTSYSLIWVQMLEAVYRFTGDLSLVHEVSDALCVLLDRFDSYLGDNGVLEHAPNYMFVDWLVTEGYSMHHPPKALGQTCLNAFYYKALTTAQALFSATGEQTLASRYAGRAAALKPCFIRCFYDQEQGLFFDGLPTPSATNEYLPANIALRHFSRHSNTLAALYGLCEDGAQARRILRQVVESETMQQVQPYFMHYVLEAVAKFGLFGQYGMRLLRLWGPLAEECDKGLKEGWFAPQEGYSFDHSHAWGGTPAYQLPARLLGFHMVDPGFKRITLSPCLFGLEWAKIAMPTPFGEIRCEMRRGCPAAIHVPPGIAYTVRTDAENDTQQ